MHLHQVRERLLAAAADPSFAGLDVEFVSHEVRTTRFDLECHIFPRGDRFLVMLGGEHSITSAPIRAWADRLERGGRKLSVLQRLGVPYTEDEIIQAEAGARAQARQIAEEIVAQGGPSGLEDKEIIAMVAYLQRLGTDLKKTPVTTADAGIGGK